MAALPHAPNFTSGVGLPHERLLSFNGQTHSMPRGGAIAKVGHQQSAFSDSST